MSKANKSAHGVTIGRLTFEVARTHSIGIGVNWNRRGIFDYGWISVQLPFVQFTVEWQPDDEAFNEMMGAA